MPWQTTVLVKVYKELKKLPSQDRAKIESAISYLEQYGPFLKEPFCKKIKPNLFELRIRGQNSFRIFYTLIRGNYYLIHVFRKKSQKIPLKEIEIALDRMKQLI